MRNRFFVVILGSLVFAAVALSAIHIYFFKTQRLKLIDRQIVESSELLLKSKAFGGSTIKVSSIENAISEVLGGARIGKVFILRDITGRIVYQSFNVGLLKIDLPIRPEWVAVQTEDEFVRVRNTTLKKNDKYVLQVGLVLDRNFVNWEIVDVRLINYIIGTVVSIFLASVFITLFLLSPLRLLIGHLGNVTSNLINLKDVKPLPRGLTRFTHGFWSRSDEFSSLLSAIQKLIDRINLNYKLTRSWTLQMAHELKTPLAIIRAETESKSKSAGLPVQYSKDVLSEIDQMTEIINQFLDWAELESSQIQKDLHSLRMKFVINNVSSRLEKISPGRIKLNLNNEFSVFANPIHLDQLVANLITNALKYSPAESQVEITLKDRTFKVHDKGSGVPREVLERLGEPFNIGETTQGVSGNGLGLAWVFTVAKLYQWKFDISSSPSGTVAEVHFPDEDIS